MKKLMLFICVLCLFAPAIPARTGAVTTTGLTDDLSPCKNSAGSRATVQFLYDLDMQAVTGNSRLIGIEMPIDSWFLTGSDTSGCYLFEVNFAGTQLIRSVATGHAGWGWRDLAWDGSYLYASDSYAIEQIDIVTGGVTGVQIPSPISPARALAYYAATDTFWTATFNSPIYQISRAGAVVNSIMNPGLAIYGAACDDGTDTIWWWSQDGSGTTATAMDALTGTFTGETWDGGTGTWPGFAGGCCIYESPCCGDKQFAGLHQSSPDNVAVYSMEPLTRDAWYFHDAGNWESGSTWEHMYGVPPTGAGSDIACDAANPFVLCTNPMTADYSGYHLSAEIWFANSLPGASNQITVELMTGTWKNPGAVLAADTRLVTNQMPQTQMYTFDFGTMTNLVLTGNSLILKISYVGPALYTHLYWDGNLSKSALFAKGAPLPDIKVNGRDEDFSIPAGSPLAVTVSLDPGVFTGVPHDWWIFVVMNGTHRFWWIWPGNWILSPVPQRALAIGLLPFKDFPIAQSALPAGVWDFYFAVDPLNNIFEGTHSDAIRVTTY